MKALLILLLCCCVAGALYGQITITASDVSTQLAVGNSLINRLDTVTTQVNIGTPGSTANTWNFSNLAVHLLDTLRSVTPAGTPYIGWFPGATHALQQRQTLMGITGTVWLYLQLNTNLLTRGAGGNGPTPLGEAVLRATNTPPEVLYQLPMTLGTTWTTTYVESLVVTIGGFPLLNQVTTHTITNTVDAFGTLTLPGSFGSHQALRIRIDDRFSGASTGRRISYQFLARNGASVQVTAADTTQPTAGDIAIDPSSTSWSGPIATDVVASAGLPKEFTLKQNYPNPFNPSTTIEYHLPGSAFVSLKVYNVLGKEIATLVNEQKSAGIHFARWSAESVPSGVYFVRMQAGSFTQTRRMVVVK